MMDNFYNMSVHVAFNLYITCGMYDTISGNQAPLHTFHTMFLLHTTNDNHSNNDANKDHQYDGCNNRHHNDNYGENRQKKDIIH